MRLSKYFALILILLTGLVTGCRHEKPIDEVFRWPPSGVAEADSLILEFERRSLEIDTPVRGYRDLEIRMCSLAAEHPENKLIQSRLHFIQYTLFKNKAKISNDSLHKLIAIERVKLDSNKHNYDWHKWTAFEIEYEPDMIKRYVKTTDNIIFFHNIGAIYESGRAHVQIGNIMKDYYDTTQANRHYKIAEDFFSSLGQKKNVFICKLNQATMSPIHARDSIYLYLMNDTISQKLGQLQILLMQNYFLDTGEVKYLDSALKIAATSSYFYEDKYIEEIPFLIALKGNYYDQIKLKPAVGKQYLIQALDSIKINDYPTRYLHMMYRMLGAAYANAGQHDSATFFLHQSILWGDSLEKELNKSQFFGLDAKNRIELAEQNFRQQRNLWIWGLTSAILIAILGIVIIIINHKRQQAIKEYKQLQVQEKLQKNLQAVKIQTMVIEENEKLIDEILGQINELRKNGEIDLTSAGALTRIMKLYKTDSEAHKGLLEVQKELSNDFIDKLREDYPSLSEGQLKLASLIAIGVESPQICRMLGIQLSSLHKSRYRLRTRLGLNNDDSLEEFLRSRNKSAL